MGMTRFLILLLCSAFLLTACESSGTGTTSSTTSASSSSSAGLYRVPRDSSRVKFRMLDAVNALRATAGVPDVQLNANLTAAAATHSRDMSVQNRPWHFGSDGSSPIDRAARAGYTRTMLGENISETFETELETLAAWMDQPDTRDVILDPEAVDMGFSWFQEPGGKIWWTLNMGGGGPALIPIPTPEPDPELADVTTETLPQG